MSGTVNLLGVSTLKTTYAFNEGLGQVTVTLSDITGATVYGTLVIEIVKHRALTEALNLIAEAYSPDNVPGLLNHRVMLDQNNNVAMTVFD
jgi:hypothetical protein